MYVYVYVCVWDRGRDTTERDLLSYIYDVCKYVCLCVYHLTQSRLAALLGLGESFSVESKSKSGSV